ncbi:hypothetical protein [Nocardia brasiliensis]|uniref:hypothetical protein n=1 Tax=Nocardia brasiliensis TaxID=37326 RepID=UPI00245588A3|nr:hypothetical protein [Nocardia brasiliensis]
MSATLHIVVGTLKDVNVRVFYLTSIGEIATPGNPHHQELFESALRGIEGVDPDYIELHQRSVRIRIGATYDWYDIEPPLLAAIIAHLGWGHQPFKVHYIQQLQDTF